MLYSFIAGEMPIVKEQGNSIPSSLHYALTDSQCNKCGAQLEWNAEFNDINSPKYGYSSSHTNQNNNSNNQCDDIGLASKSDVSPNTPRADEANL